MRKIISQIPRGGRLCGDRRIMLPLKSNFIILLSALLVFTISSCGIYNKLEGLYFSNDRSPKNNTLLELNSDKTYTYTSAFYPLGRLDKRTHNGTYTIQGNKLILESDTIPYKNFKPYRVVEYYVKGMDSVIVCFQHNMLKNRKYIDSLSDTEDEQADLFLSKKIFVDKWMLTGHTINKERDTFVINQKRVKYLQPEIRQVGYQEYKVQGKRSNMFVIQFDTLYKPDKNNIMGCFFDKQILIIKNKKKLIMDRDIVLELNSCKRCFNEDSFLFRKLFNPRSPKFATLEQ